jgi:hypothetical protein
MTKGQYFRQKDRLEEALKAIDVIGQALSYPFIKQVEAHMDDLPDMRDMRSQIRRALQSLELAAENLEY